MVRPSTTPDAAYVHGYIIISTTGISKLVHLPDASDTVNPYGERSVYLDVKKQVSLLRPVVSCHQTLSRDVPWAVCVGSRFTPLR